MGGKCNIKEKMMFDNTSRHNIQRFLILYDVVENVSVKSIGCNSKWSKLN